MSKPSEYKVSFVLPVYNTENYVAETIESILRQDIGFEKNCELVIVNDGSTDNSESVCLGYKNKYPDNIRYIKQKNQGVAAALNKAMKSTKGTYICIIGSDDKISPDAAAKLHDFMESHGNEVDFAAIKMELFEAMTGDHPLNYKFTHTKVVKVEEDFNHVILATGGVFLKRSLVKEGFLFNESLAMYEDAEFLSRIILRKMAYGVVVGPTYYYRKRIGGGSLVSNKGNDRRWYLDVTKNVHEKLFTYAKKSIGYVPKYIQYVVMYDLQWQIRWPKTPPLGRREMKTYENIRSRLLRQIDDDVITSQRNMYAEYIFHTLSLKYGRDMTPELRYKEDGKLYFKDIAVFNGNRQTVRIEFLDVKNDHLEIRGWYGGFKLDGLQAFARVGDERYELKDEFRPYSTVCSLGEVIYKNNAFKVLIPLKPGDTTIDFVVTVKNKVVKMRTDYWKFAKLSKNKCSYRVVNGHILLGDGNHLIVRENTRKERVKREVKYVRELIGKGEFNAVTYRMLYFAARPFFAKKKVWLVSDRPNSAGDNGEYFFRYAAKHRRNDAKVYFAISRKTEKYRELKKVGNVVPYHSLRFKILFLLADKRISSMFDEYIINDFGKEMRGCIGDLYGFEYVYLNHGVLTSDSSKQFGKMAKNARLLTVGSEAEKQSIVTNKNYLYDESNVAVTGLPRFDPLTSEPKKTIVFMPTWRSGLAGLVRKRGEVSYDQRSYNDTFKSSEYFQFYNKLINDPKLLKKLKQHGYTIEFCIHPSLGSHWKDFDASERVVVKTPPYNYVEILKQGSLLVTDYSGVAFDFAYMKKPVVYTQFDKDTLYEDHYYQKGYFSFEKNGFGAVSTDYNSALCAIIDAIESECVMPRKYQRRVDAFFYKLDHNNSKRVYDAILQLDNKGE